MKLTLMIKLRPSQEQVTSLLETMGRFNVACNGIAEVAFREKTASKFRLQKVVYQNVRSQFELSAQMTIRAISKRLVAKGKGTGRGIALEDLQGIRDRITVTKAQRRSLHSWSFHQLRTSMEYKSRLAGVPVVLVDPRNTSRTCPACGHCEKANRPSRDQFRCICCGFAGPADTIAAINIGRRAIV